MVSFAAGPEVSRTMLRGVRSAKDKRLLPSGLDTVSAPAVSPVRGHATADAACAADGGDVRTLPASAVVLATAEARVTRR